MPLASTMDREVLTKVARLRLAIGRLERRLRQHSSTNLSPTQLSVFGSIQQLGPISLGELGPVERLSAASISKTATSLEELGLIERVRDEHDHRVWRVRVTARGEAWATDRRRERTTWLAERFAHLTPHEQDALLGALPVLERLVEHDGD
jgi:DNA-binding MarR family transcriptional regulator